jgi:hypothetical protein
MPDEIGAAERVTGRPSTSAEMSEGSICSFATEVVSGTWGA